ncbi:hypothetical protein MTO96_017068 [Rhipicephalus appendiculatus]
MSETYCQQREFLNSVPPKHTADAKEEWPMLFKRSFFYAHSNRLLGKNVKETFQENVKIIGPSLVRHLQNINKREIIHLLVDVEQQEKKGNSKACEAALVPLLAAFFKDDAGLIYRIIPFLCISSREGTSLSDVLLELPSTPVIVAVGSLHEKCYVVCEQVEMFAEAVGFSEAACLCFLTYYVCNMAYPDAAAASLEFLQRQIFDINPAKGSKWKSGQKSRTTVHAKVMKLAQALREDM